MPNRQASYTRFWFSQVEEPTDQQLIHVATQLARLSEIYTGPGTMASVFPAPRGALVLAGRAGQRRTAYKRYIRAYGDPNRFNPAGFDEPSTTLTETLKINLQGATATGVVRQRSRFSIVPGEKRVERFEPVAEATAILSELAAGDLPNGCYVLHPPFGMAFNSWRLQASMRPDYD